MNRDKQIEEMASDLENHTCMSQFQAEIASRTLYAIGYRKASDVAREIFEKLEKDLLKSQAICDKQADKCGWNLERRKEFEGESDGIGYCLQKIAKLKKRYTEGR